MSKPSNDGSGLILVFLLLAFVLLVLASCGAADPVTGTVTDRHTEEAKTESDCEPDTDGPDAGTLDCEWEDVPECLSLTVTSADGTVHTWCAERDEYDTYALGDVYPHPSPGTTS